MSLPIVYWVGRGFGPSFHAIFTKKCNPTTKLHFFSPIRLVYWLADAMSFCDIGHMTNKISFFHETDIKPYCIKYSYFGSTMLCVNSKPTIIICFRRPNQKGFKRWAKCNKPIFTFALLWARFNKAHCEHWEKDTSYTRGPLCIYASLSVGTNRTDCDPLDSPNPYTWSSAKTQEYNSIKN